MARLPGQLIHRNGKAAAEEAEQAVASVKSINEDVYASWKLNRHSMSDGLKI
jgi:hypothetical protein